ncbi:MAG: hypothetical protein WCY29_16190 [Novosphingobium sp.]
MITYWTQRLVGAAAMVDPRLLPETAKYGLDGLSVAATVGVFVSLLPHVASLLSIVWMALRIYETRTVQKWFGRADAGEDKTGEDKTDG